MNASLTAPTLSDLAGAALKILARDGAPTPAAAHTDEPGWRIGCEASSGTVIDISLAGPDIPAGIEEDVVPPEMIAKERPWKGTYRLAILAPLIVFDVAWSPGEPVRIMTFSRGDWETDLIEIAG